MLRSDNILSILDLYGKTGSNLLTTLNVKHTSYDLCWYHFEVFPYGVSG